MYYYIKYSQQEKITEGLALHKDKVFGMEWPLEFKGG